MCRRRVLLGLGALILLGAAAWVTTSLLPTKQKHNITEDGYERIKKGMTLAEVEAIMGGPAGNYTNGQYDRGFAIAGGAAYYPLNEENPPRVEEWIGEERRVGVVIYRDQVLTKYWGEVYPVEATILDRIRKLNDRAGLCSCSLSSSDHAPCRIGLAVSLA